MGGAVSSGADNDELIDNLHAADYIRTELVERVFRAVDRGEYILPDFRGSAYKDQAWRYNHLHLSAPCIYSEVMEGLNVMPGNSFLNLGSGTGYLSTMVGLILGSNGINHGVEFYEDVITYANKRLDDFKKYSGAIDEFDFCEPKFMKGNCLCLTCEQRYDRIYVGAAVPESFDPYIKNLLSIGGILIMPVNEQLLQVKRTSTYAWTVSSLLPVSFSMLIIPPVTKETLRLAPMEPQSLQTMCRSLIRNTLRSNIDAEMPDLKCRQKSQQKKPRPKRNRKLNRVQNVMIPTGPGRRESFFDIENEDDVREYLSFVLERAVDERELENEVDLRRHRVHSLNIIDDHQDSSSSSDDNNADADDDNDDDDDGNVEMCTNQPENAEIIIEHREPGSSTQPSQSNSSGTQSRQKFDSGIGDESQSDDAMSCQGNEEECDNGSKRLLKTEDVSCKWRRIDKSLDNDSDSTSSSDNEDDFDEETCPPTQLYKRRTVDSPYTRHMFEKIGELPLPPILKDYVNFYRF